LRVTVTVPTAVAVAVAVVVSTTVIVPEDRVDVVVPPVSGDDFWCAGLDPWCAGLWAVLDEDELTDCDDADPLEFDDPELLGLGKLAVGGLKPRGVVGTLKVGAKLSDVGGVVVDDDAVVMTVAVPQPPTIKPAQPPAARIAIHLRTIH
jgi:hypothetical protein